MKPCLLTTEIPDPTGWHLSTKLDGIRAVFSGSRLLTRSGHDLKPPAWFLARFPAVRTDGELWMGDGTFDRLASTIQRHGSDWMGVEYHVFDLAGPGTFEERQAALRKLVLPDHVHLVRHRICAGWDDLDREEREVVANGGEGCVIRRPGSLYRPGRMGDVVKIKRIAEDAERWQG